MLRKLLALLAVCAGLVAVAEPARAMVSVVESVRQVEGAGLTCAPVAPGTPDKARPASERLLEKSRPCPKPTIILIVPTVMLQADRARE